MMPECKCVPGAIILCDADCRAGIYCLTNAHKTCLPDGTWTVCKEDGTPAYGPLSGASNAPCAHIGLGCSGCNGGKGWYVGDCTKQLMCEPNAPYCPADKWGGYSDSGSLHMAGGMGTCTCRK